MKNRSQIYTIGYQQRSAEDVVDLLVDAGVDVLIDVREYPLSRKKGLSKTPLSKLLEECGIEYVHARYAGNPKRLRDAAESHEQCLQMYEDYLNDNLDIIESFDALLRQYLEREHSVCLMCYERHPLDCHRSVLLCNSAVNVETHHLGKSGADRFTQREVHCDP